MINIIKGILIAISLLVPGVSGGTMMIILGVYDQVIEVLSKLISFKLIHVKLIIQLAIGGLLGLALFSNGMLWALSRFPYIMSYLFLGIIAIGLLTIMKRVRWDQFRPYHILFLFGGILIAIVMTMGQSSALFDFSGSFFRKLLMILIAGIIIAVALILPGISTSFLLLALGLYEETLTAIKLLDWSYIIPLGIGIVAGVFLTTRVLEYLMKEHPTPTYLMIIGFIVGSIGEIYPGWPLVTRDKFYSVFAFLFGSVVMVLIHLIIKKSPQCEREG